MSTKEGKVVVVSPVTTFRNETDGLFAASFSEMGLTAFGTTPEKARHALKMVFRTYIRECREHGLLEKTLNRLGAKWEWEKEYPANGPEYEDTDPAPWTEQQWQHIMDSEAWSPSPGPPATTEAANNELTMAA